MFGLDPFDRSVAAVEMVLLLALAALIGWLIGWLLSRGRVRSLRKAIADAPTRRQTRATTPIPARGSVAEPTILPQSADADVKPPRPVAADVTLVPTDVKPVIEVPPIGAPIPEASPSVDAPGRNDGPVESPGVDSPEAPVPVRSSATEANRPPVGLPADELFRPGNTEAAVLNRIAARVHEINFDRIGRATAADADDLKDIIGIGPFLERKLHSLGIYTYRQVANFTKEDGEQINDLIEFFPGRIERDDWVRQAKQLHERKQGVRSGETGPGETRNGQA